MQTLIVLFDQLPAHWLGCYGNTEAETPAFDRLAAHGVTFDTCFADGLQGGFASLGTAVRACVDQETAVVVTGDPNTALFQQLSALPNGHIVTALTGAGDRIAELTAAVESGTAAGDDFLIVVSLEGPTSESDMAGADTAVGAITALFTTASSTSSLLILSASRGESLPSEAAGVLSTAELDERAIHVPLLLQSGEPLEYGVRCPALISIDDVATTLQEMLGVAGIESATGRSLRFNADAGHPEPRECLILQGANDMWAIRTPDWFLITRLEEIGSSDIELNNTGLSNEKPDERKLAQAAELATLYAKPGDVWNQLDVAAQCPDVVQKLVERLLTSGAVSLDSRS